MQRSGAVLAFLMLAATALTGCAWFEDLTEPLRRPDHAVNRTVVQEGEYTTQDRFQVLVRSGTLVPVAIEAVERDTGEVVRQEGLSDVSTPVVLRIPDGAWDITYWVDGHRWEHFENVLVKATPPQVEGLERIGTAVGGVYTIGNGVSHDADRVRIVDLQSGALLATRVPYTVSGLEGDHVYSFLVAFGDLAGNWHNATVQVQSGAAAALPDTGAYTFGVVARYTNEVRIWDLTDLSTYATLSQAQAATSPGFLGSGFGITPDDPVIQAIVDEVVDPSMQTTAEVAFALYQWLFDNLEYDHSRLDTSDLLDPAQTVERGGGVCRDLAALYVSLLRAAGVPARVVSGYLAGNVNGFHAWVEFYGGRAGEPGQWVPVDVSPIEGDYNPAAALSAFGVQHPEYLTLRKVPAGGETEGWSTALSVHYHYYGREPELSFEKHLETVGEEQRGVLCVNPDTLDRMVATEAQSCNGGRFGMFLPSFLVASTRIIDYGILLLEAAEGTEVTATVAYPFPHDAHPDRVEYIVYGDPDLVDSWSPDAARGVFTTSFTVG